MVELFHPDLGVTITVSEGAAQVHLANGWQYVVEPAAVEPEPVDDAPVVKEPRKRARKPSKEE